MVPRHLESISWDIRCFTLTSRMTVRCHCGCTEHYLYVAERDEADRLAEEKNRRTVKSKFGRNYKFDFQPDGVYIYGRGLFGIKRRMRLSDLCSKFLPTFKEFSSIKCSACGREYVLFDERIHGKSNLLSSPVHKKSRPSIYGGEPVRVEIFVFYDNSEVYKLPESERSEAYNRIKITIKEKSNPNERRTILDYNCN